MKRKAKGYLSIYVLLVISVLFMAILTIFSYSEIQAKISRNTENYLQSVYIGESKLAVAMSPKYYNAYILPFLSEDKEKTTFTIDAHDVIFGDTGNEIQLSVDDKETMILSCRTQYMGTQLTTKARYIFSNKRSIFDESGFRLESEVLSCLNSVSPFCVDSYSTTEATIFSLGGDVFLIETELLEELRQEVYNSESVAVPLEIEEESDSEMENGSLAEGEAEQVVAEPEPLESTGSYEERLLDKIRSHSSPNVRIPAVDQPFFAKIRGELRIEGDPFSLRGIIVAEEVFVDTQVHLDGLLLYRNTMTRSEGSTLAGAVVVEKDGNVVTGAENSNGVGKYVEDLSLSPVVTLQSVTTTEGY